MNTIRIPTRYKKQLSRLDDKERLWFYDSMMRLATGEKIEIPDTIAGDILELVWRDCLQMAKKSRDYSEELAGDIVQSTGATMSETYSPSEVKGSEGKGREEKRKEKKGNEITLSNDNAVPEKKEYGNKEINEMLAGLKKFINIPDFKDSQKFQRFYGKHFVNLLAKIGQEEFRARLQAIINDDFKLKNCNSLKYLYGQVKSTSTTENLNKKPKRKLEFY